MITVDTIEICVIFKKDALLAKAELLLKSLKYPYHQGCDSSRGRIYFDSTGPKFIVTINRADLESFMAKLRKHASVHEAYEADWEIFKD